MAPQFLARIGGVHRMDYKKAIIYLVGRMKNLETLKKIYLLVWNLYLREN